MIEWMLSVKPTQLRVLPQTLFARTRYKIVRVNYHERVAIVTVASVRDSAPPKNKTTAERSEDVENNSVISFLLCVFSFLYLRNKEKKIHV